MTRIKRREQERKEKRDDIKEKIGMIVAVIIFSLIVAFLAFAPFVSLAYVIIGNLFIWQNILTVFLIFVICWGWLGLILLNIFG